MKRIIRNIPIYILLLAALVYYAHMIIPHDHHPSDSDICQEKTRTVSHTSSNHHRGFPVHCHAFNDLTSEKAISYVIIKYDQCIDFMTGCIFDSNIYDLPSFSIILSDVFNKPVHSGIPRLSSLRAPPAIG